MTFCFWGVFSLTYMRSSILCLVAFCGQLIWIRWPFRAVNETLEGWLNGGKSPSIPSLPLQLFTTIFITPSVGAGGYVTSGSGSGKVLNVSSFSPTSHTGTTQKKKRSQGYFNTSKIWWNNLLYPFIKRSVGIRIILLLYTSTTVFFLRYFSKKLKNKINTCTYGIFLLHAVFIML